MEEPQTLVRLFMAEKFGNFKLYRVFADNMHEFFSVIHSVPPQFIYTVIRRRLARHILCRREEGIQEDEFSESLMTYCFIIKYYAITQQAPLENFYPSNLSLLAKYPEFLECSEKELNILLQFRNSIVLALKFINPIGNEQLFRDIGMIFVQSVAFQDEYYDDYRSLIYERRHF
jgi:hypothetical protein